MTDSISIPAIRADGLQLDEDRAFQEGYWRVQRASWLGYGLVLLVALVGLTGSGGMLHMQEIRFSAATIQIPRVARWEAWDELRISFDGPADHHKLGIGTGFFRLFEIGRIQPDPQENSLNPKSHQMHFSAQGSGPHEVRISTRPMHFGWARFEMDLDGESRTVRILVLP